MPPDDAWRWNQALIEFGALQCTARKPACVICPLQSQCAAFPAIQSVIAALPVGNPQEARSALCRLEPLLTVAGSSTDCAQPRARRIALSELGPMVRDDYAAEHAEWLLKLVRDLERDGLARIAEPRATYSTEKNDDPLVSLP